MSPELVEDRPYDHNADLWALGCILYEINTGYPPFYTNNLYQLVDMIVKGQVKWPKTMSIVFKNFLQGLLCKDPNKRLSWPQLGQHEFVKSGIKSLFLTNKFTFRMDQIFKIALLLKVPDLTASIMEPLTIQMTDEQVKRKQEQQRAKAPPPGQSRILSRATRDQKKAQNKPQAVLHQPKIQPQPEQTTLAPPKPINSNFNGPQQAGNVVAAAINNTESSAVKNAPQSPVSEAKTNSKITDNQADIEEWQNLAEELNPETNFELCEKYLQDEAFLNKLKQRLATSKQSMLESKIEGDLKKLFFSTKYFIRTFSKDFKF